MPRVIPVLCGVALAAAATVAAQGQAASSGRPIAYEGARLIVGDGSAPIELGVMVVRDGRIAAVGPKSSVTVPIGRSRIVVLLCPDSLGDAKGEISAIGSSSIR